MGSNLWIFPIQENDCQVHTFAGKFVLEQGCPMRGLWSHHMACRLHTAQKQLTWTSQAPAAAFPTSAQLGRAQSACLPLAQGTMCHQWCPGSKGGCGPPVQPARCRRNPRRACPTQCVAYPVCDPGPTSLCLWSLQLQKNQHFPMKNNCIRKCLIGSSY